MTEYEMSISVVSIMWPKINYQYFSTCASIPIYFTPIQWLHLISNFNVNVLCAALYVSLSKGISLHHSVEIVLSPTLQIDLY